MPKINGLPSGTLSSAQVYERLGRIKQGMQISGLSEFLEYHQVGRSRLYLAYDVAKMRYWLFVRQGLIALGHLRRTSPLLPPGETYEARRNSFEAWFNENPNGATCPHCGGEAVQSLGEGPIWCPEGPIWCPECGVQGDD